MNIVERLEKEKARRIGSDHMDAHIVDVFPIPLIILGGGYQVLITWLVNLSLPRNV